MSPPRQPQAVHTKEEELLVALVLIRWVSYKLWSSAIFFLHFFYQQRDIAESFKKKLLKKSCLS